VVIDDFDVISSILLPNKTDTELIVDADAVLPYPIASQWFQHVSRWITEIVQTGGCIHAVEFAPSNGFNIPPSPIRTQLRKFRSVTVFETPNHAIRVYCMAFNVKQLS
jgi:hypothetical protein